MHGISVTDSLYQISFLFTPSVLSSSFLRLLVSESTRNFMLHSFLSSTSFILPFIVVMASKLDRDDYIYDVENLSGLMASMDANGIETGARPKKSK